MAADHHDHGHDHAEEPRWKHDGVQVIRQDADRDGLKRKAMLHCGVGLPQQVDVCCEQTTGPVGENDREEIPTTFFRNASVTGHVLATAWASTSALPTLQENNKKPSYSSYRYIRNGSPLAPYFL